MTADDLKLRDFILTVDLMREKLSDRKLSPVDAGRTRELWLGKCLSALAARFEVRLREPLVIDSRGEYSLQALPERPGARETECGAFGAGFAEVLNPHQPRTGVKPGAIMTSTSGWCYMNHFDVERLVMSADASLRPRWHEAVMRAQVSDTPESIVASSPPARRPKAV